MRGGGTLVPGDGHLPRTPPGVHDRGHRSDPRKWQSVSSSPAPTSLQEVTVGDVMRPATTTVETDAHLASAAYLMKRTGDSALVVMPGDGAGGPVAVLTDAHISQAVADGRDLNEMRIHQL